MEKVERFLEKRKRELSEEMGSSSYYVVSVTPIFVDTEIMNIRDSHLRNLLQQPPEIRPMGWCVPNGLPPQPTLHGLKVTIEDWKSVELFRNGHIMLLVAITEDSFLARIQTETKPFPLLDGCPLVEYPLSLLRLAKAIYAHLGLTDPAVVSLSLYNISGFRLLRDLADPHRQRTLSSRVDFFAQPWRKPFLEISLMQDPSLEMPEQIVKRMADRLWQTFGYEQTPFFDAAGKFVTR